MPKLGALACDFLNGRLPLALALFVFCIRLFVSSPLRNCAVLLRTPFVLRFMCGDGQRFYYVWFSFLSLGLVTICDAIGGECAGNDFLRTSKFSVLALINEQPTFCIG